jgi:hypothetical protein
MKKSLYSIEEEYQILMQNIEEAEGEITEEQAEQLVINEGERDAKSLAYICLIKSKEGYIDMLDKEIARLTALKKAEKNTIQRLKDNLLVAVKLFGEYGAGMFKVSTRKSTSLLIDEDVELPGKYIVTKVTESPDKKAIKEAIKNGEEIQGASLSTNLNLAIK